MEIPSAGETFLGQSPEITVFQNPQLRINLLKRANRLSTEKKINILAWYTQLFLEFGFESDDPFLICLNWNNCGDSWEFSLIFLSNL